MIRTMVDQTSEAELRSSIEGLESREALYMGESVRLVDPDNPDVRISRWREYKGGGRDVCEMEENDEG